MPSTPFGHVVARLDDFLYLIGQHGEEVEMGDALNIVDGVDIAVALVVACLILVDEAYGTRSSTRDAREHDLKEGIGDSDLMTLTDVAILGLRVQDGATHNIYRF